ncbi:MAG TPA: glycoside hydrolase family 6 protein [Candidatus Limnocylindrales bacterium]
MNPTEGYVWQRHPFLNAKLFLDRESAGAHWQSKHGAGWLDPITKTPQAVWLTSEWDLTRLPTLVRKASEQEALLVVVTYFIPNRDCGGHGADTAGHYLSWIDRVLEALGRTPAVVIMEPDAVPAECFNQQRAEMLAAGVKKLTGGGHYVYLDAGHPRWLTTAEAARRLLIAGIREANGFSLNVANRQTTESSQRYGLELSNLVGDREFVIDTSRNGLGPPPDDPYREDEWCNPHLQALGDPPTTLALAVKTAALLWIKRPGESDGPCRGETGFEFSPIQARNLVVSALRLPPEVREAARSAQLSQPAAAQTPRRESLP